MDKPTRKTMADLKKVQGITATDAPEQVTETTETTTETAQTEETTTTETPEVPETTETTQTTEASTSVTTPTASVDMVSISATEIAQLRADSKELHLMKPQYAVLEKWYKNMAESGAVTEKDASDLSPKKVSKATQKAIDIKNSRK